MVKKQGWFMVNCLGIVYEPRTRKILIGKRPFDPYVKKLRWQFPGGRPKKKTLEQSLAFEINRKTGIRVKVVRLVHARTFLAKMPILLLYYLCKPVGGRLRAGEKFTDVKWVRPTEVKKWFTTSIDPKVFRFLKGLEG